MGTTRGVSLVFAGVVGLAVVIAAAAPAWSGKEKDKDKKAAPGGKSLPPGVTLNACGCYKSGQSCVCTDRKAKCECPGDCEPVGCEEKRQKDLEREYAAEVKRAQEEDKKRKAAEEAAEAAEAAGTGDDQDKGGEKTADKSGEKPPGPEASAPKPGKPGRKETPAPGSGSARDKK